MARAARAVAPLVLFVLLPLVVAAAQWSDLSGRFDTYGFDFRGTLWEPARAVLDGTSPYPHPDDPSIVTGNPSVYPPLAILALVPLARVDFDVAYVLWSVLLIGAVAGALRIVGLRDWRCYSLGLLSPPVVYGVFFGNITLLLLLPLALAWRWRRHAVRVGLAVAALVAVKPFLLPLALWLALTRRWRATVVAPGRRSGADRRSVGRDRVRRLSRLPATRRPRRVGVRAGDGLPACCAVVASPPATPPARSCAAWRRWRSSRWRPVGGAAPTATSACSRL